jgi:hypothetical protein
MHYLAVEVESLAGAGIEGRGQGAVRHGVHGEVRRERVCGMRCGL